MDHAGSIGSANDLSIASSFRTALASSPYIVPAAEPESCTSSAFGDSDCGEPLKAHHICLDFTPTDADNDVLQKKCCDFWKYITSRPELQHIMVMPELDESNQHGSTDSSVSVPKPAPTESIEKTKTAVSMLQIVENKGLIDRAFEARMQKSSCTIGSQEYELGAKAKSKCKCPSPCKMCPNDVPVRDSQTLCEELRAWDVSHPKSMEPPGQPPAVIMGMQ